MAPALAVGDCRRMRHAREIRVQIVRQFESSGLTQEAYAEQRGIPVGTLRAWIYKLRREGKGTPLLPVRVIASIAPGARQPEDGAGGIEIDVGEALRVRLPSGTSMAMVAELIARLRARC